MLNTFYTSLSDRINANGVILLGNTRNYSLMFKIWSGLFPGHFKSKDKKKIGWMRDIDELKKWLPTNLKPVKTFSYYHDIQVPLKGKFATWAKAVVF